MEMRERGTGDTYMTSVHAFDYRSERPENGRGAA